ncbi:Sucrase-isomaltase, intestinal [Myotis brandtii]|uniref:Maltase n=1 Tax=Myotis brandtii TaxID=109478 RepID=S7Q8S2_MYOBR|nr:Sucrase-isomaltase, intestinal [Myotis brandtii]
MKFPIQNRVDCHPQPGASREVCEAKGCVWCSTTVANVPWCFYPADGPHGYTMKDVPQKTAQGWRWETTLGGLIFSNQYIQLMTSVPSTSIYGFGEHEHPSFKHDMNYVRYGMFSRDQSPVALSNLYGVHPFYMCIEKDFNAHGVLLLNSNAQDVTLSPSPSLTFRTIGGILDFYMFLGPTPENVIQQYTEAIGRPFMPPYWSLGFQLSRWGYNSIDVLEKTVERLRQYDIPHDVQYGDIDYMERQLDFTYDKANFAGLPEYIKKLKNDGMHYVIILDPFLTKDEPQGTYRPYELGQELGIWVNNSDGITPAVGKAWPPGDSVYPDYTNPKTAEWWIQMCMEFKNILDYDGIWIDMNEPSNFQNGQQPGCEENHLNYPPYVPDSVEKGEYFYVEYKFSNRSLKATVIKNGYNGITTLAYSTIQILGFTSKPNVIFMNGKTIPSNRMQYNSNGAKQRSRYEGDGGERKELQEQLWLETEDSGRSKEQRLKAPAAAKTVSRVKMAPRSGSRVPEENWCCPDSIHL